MKQRGFTLIETVIYLALFAILMSGVIAVAYNMFELSVRNQTQALLQDEGNFLMGKVSWALSGTASINQPVVGILGSQLSVNKVTGVNSSGNPIITPVVIALSGTNVTIQEGSAPAVALNNSNIQITRLSFLHTLGTGVITPESVEASTTLTARTPNGMVITQDFSTTGYLRR